MCKISDFNLSDIRHQLHRLAEPSGEEVRTHAFILEQLKACSPSRILTFGDTQSIIAVFEGEEPGQTLLFRGDFDAVRVEETIDVPYASEMAGVAHKCGHDGHATILLGLARDLHQRPLVRGRVLLFFQAAEETGDGAQQLIETGVLDRYTPDRVFALHNIPGEKLGTVLGKPGSFTCSVVSCEIVLKGRSAHAAEPLKAISPYPAARSITDKLLLLNNYDMHKEDYRLLTLVEFRVGEEAYGVAAGDGVLRFTLRAKEDARLQQTKAELVRIVEEEVAKTEGVSHTISWKEYFAASNNHEEAMVQVKAAANRIDLDYKELELPFSWGEDFGLFTQHYPGALFGLGSGLEQPSLHNPYFNFPDELLPIGVRLFRELVQ